MLSVSWMHLGFLDEMQLYDLAFRVCARLGSLQTLLPVYHDALQQYMSLVRTPPSAKTLSAIHRSTHLSSNADCSRCTASCCCQIAFGHCGSG